MAYASTVTGPTRFLLVDGRQYYKVVVTETEASSASTAEATITGLPTILRLLKVSQYKASGTGTTGRPELSPVPNATNTYRSTDGGYRAAAAGTFGAGDWSDNPEEIILAPSGTLYHRSGVNSAVADHSVTTLYILVEGI